MRLLVTGGCGFVGSNFIRYVLQHFGPEMITNVDALTTGRLANLDGVAETCGDRYEFLHADLSEDEKVEAVLAKHQFFGVVHFAGAEAEATERLVERARRHGVRRFLLVSKTGAAGHLAAAEECALASHREHGEEVVIARSSWNYGPCQSPAGFIPKIILAALRDQPVLLPGDGEQTRDWLHVEDHCAALFSALLDGQPGTVYHFGSGSEVRDLDVALRVLECLGKSRELIAVSPAVGTATSPQVAVLESAIEALAWKPRHLFEHGLRETVEWYVRNREWWEASPEL